MGLLKFLGFKKQEENPKLLFENLTQFLNKLLEICDRNNLTNVLVDEITTFVNKMQPLIQKYKSQYPTFNTYHLKVLLKVITAGALKLAERTETIENNNDRKDFLNIINKILKACNAIYDTLPGKKKVI